MSIGQDTLEEKALTKVIRHGRDNKLLIWLLSEIDEPHLEKTLPVDIKDTTNSSATKQPWLLHAMPVNAMNFCSFAMCQDVLTQPHMSKHLTNGESKAGPILVAVPNVLDSSGVCLSYFKYPPASIDSISD